MCSGGELPGLLGKEAHQEVVFKINVMLGVAKALEHWTFPDTVEGSVNSHTLEGSVAKRTTALKVSVPFGSAIP
jgi:hypothetical protein